LDAHLQVAPFMALKLIQRFTSSNPSPRYVRAVVEGFRTGTHGGRTFSGAYGDMGALFAAILLDREARSTTLDADSTHGQLREPSLKLIHMLRTFNFGHPKLQHFAINTAGTIGQFHMHSPTVVRARGANSHTYLAAAPLPLLCCRCFVAASLSTLLRGCHRQPQFNFYDPLYAPEGPVSEAGLISPEAELGTGPFVVGFLNTATSAIRSSWLRGTIDGRWDTSGIDMNDAAAVITELDLLMSGGRLNSLSRSVIARRYNLAKGVQANGVAGTVSEALRRAQELFLFTAEFHSTNLLMNREASRRALPVIPSQGRPYRAVVYIFLDGGADSFNLMVPTGGCTGGEGTDLWAQWAAQRGNNAIPAASLLPITADTASQPCSQFGLHPDMTTLQQEYVNGDAAMIANVGPLVQPVTKRTLARGAPRPPSLYSHNTQRLTAQNVHAQASSSAKGVMGRMLAALAVESPSGEPPHRVKSYSIAGNTKIMEGSLEAPNIVSASGPVLLSRYTDVWSDVQSLLTTEAESVYGETYAQILEKAVEGAEELQV
jgi:cullin-associated NEDD8-dissociated protein 1